MMGVHLNSKRSLHQKLELSRRLKYLLFSDKYIEEYIIQSYGWYSILNTKAVTGYPPSDVIWRSEDCSSDCQIMSEDRHPVTENLNIVLLFDDCIKYGRLVFTLFTFYHGLLVYNMFSSTRMVHGKWLN